MKRCFCLLNHEITDLQKKELSSKYGVDKVIMPDIILSKSWASIPTTDKLDVEYLSPVLDWLSTMNKIDIAFIQGEMTATFYIVNKLLDLNITVLSSTTHRVCVENREGEIVQRSYVFEHVCFRPYIKD